MPVALVLALLPFTGACSRKIGDTCTTNVECSPLGDRFCDLSSSGGYCTVEGCDSKSCPDGAACVSFYSLQRGGRKCTAGLVARADCNSGDCCKPGSSNCCHLGERCLCDEAGCQLGYCASETTEHRWCMRACDEQSDCRPGYTCYSTNSGGAVAVAVLTDAGADIPELGYCAPNTAPAPPPEMSTP